MAQVSDKWKFINKLRGNEKRSKTNINRLVNSFGDVVTDDTKIANLLNYTFSALGEYFGRKRPYVNNVTTRSGTFRFRFITEMECLIELNKLNPAKPTGPSIIPSWALKDSSTVIARHLTMVINEFIFENKFPKSFKMADIIPIHKKGDTNRPKPTIGLLQSRALCPKSLKDC